MDTNRTRPRDEIAERIECYIIEHQLKPGDRLPSERQMCEAWNCNRMTLRAAAKRLIAEGILANVPVTGYFVAQPKLERYLQDLRSFTDVVREKGLTIETRVISRCVVPATRRQAEKLQIPDGSDVFELVRLRIVAGEPVYLETTTIPCIRFPAIETFDYENISHYAVMEREYGLVFGSGREEISITYTDAREAELMNVPEGEAVFFIQEITWDDQGLPIELAKSISRTDRIRFAGTLLR